MAFGLEAGLGFPLVAIKFPPGVIVAGSVSFAGGVLGVAAILDEFIAAGIRKFDP